MSSGKEEGRPAVQKKQSHRMPRAAARYVFATTACSLLRAVPLFGSARAAQRGSDTRPPILPESRGRCFSYGRSRLAPDVVAACGYCATEKVLRRECNAHRGGDVMSDAGLDDRKQPTLMLQ